MSALPWINSLWRVPAIVLATGILSSFSVLFSVFDSSGRLQHACARIWGKFALLAGNVRVDVAGLEHIRQKRGYIFVANHLSMFDHWAFLAKLPCQFRFVSKASLFNIPFLGWHLKRAGNLPITDNHRQAVRDFQAAEKHIRNGISYVIYPEGERTWGRMVPFRRGSLLLPVHSSAPIVPVTILFAHKRLPRGSAVIRGGRMGLILHAPIEPEDYLGVPLEDLAKRVQGIVSSAYREEE